MSTTTDISSQKAADSDILLHYQDILRHRLLIMLLLVAAIVASLLLDFTMGPSGLSLDAPFPVEMQQSDPLARPG